MSDDAKRTLTGYLKRNDLNFRLGDITDFKKLGEGGNGIVYEGKLQGQIIAVKFLVNSDRGKLTRFKAEYLNVALLPANNLIAKPLLYEEFVIDGQTYPAIVMKRYDGHLKRSENPSAKDIHKLMKFLVDCLKLIHSHGIIHRDLKPENILVNGDSFALSDFGIAHYNPEIFALREQTRTGERIANRLFSAPEQETPNTPAHETMDIFALGQICQWYGAGSAHRGTNRVTLSSTIADAELFDIIIDKCLAHNPKDRFQTATELAETGNRVLEEKRRQEEKRVREPVDPMKFLHPFGMALGASFPRGIGKASFSDNNRIIGRLVTNISVRFNLPNQLWWFDNEGGNMHFNFIKLDDETWLMGDPKAGEEVKIRSVWVYHDSDYHADTVLLNLAAMPPFGIYEEDTVKLNEELEKRERVERSFTNTPYRTHVPSEEAALVDNSYYVTRPEYDNGFAEVGEDVVHLSEHDVSLRFRHLKERSLFVTTRQHTLFRKASEDQMLAFLNEHNGGVGITEEVFMEFIREVRKNKHSRE